MQTVTVSPKYQVVIPREIREQLGLKPGEKLQVFRVGNRVELMRVRPLEELYGMLPGLSTTVEDDPDRELSMPPTPIAKL